MPKVAKTRRSVASSKVHAAGYVICNRADAWLAFSTLGENQITTDEKIAAIQADTYIQPALAFHIGRDLARPTAADIAAAVDTVAAAAVFSQERKKASITRVILGAAYHDLHSLNLATLGCLLECNGELVESAAGTPLIGNVLGAISALATSAVAPHGLRGGTLIVACGIMPPVPMVPPSHYAITFARLGSVWATTR